ncbi:phosphoenolpyruvate synthase [Methylacidiphilum caldifontis]|uniref:phosphoenolpyruvate synthase n=1 Tax=Methylacidiphilum caldifontis TaxID=2795386 RepID=UPI001A8DE3B7|nr:phosphoenolpyruvate synthase [Methylacidiphilum caldifontis]QSR88568.1 phosphoenolpyruvate synthase [Methylacidiphilum caldifontis]
MSIKGEVCNSTDYVLWFNQITIEDIAIVGGKNASLGEMMKELSPFGINIPNGFAITSLAYEQFINFNNIRDEINNKIRQINYSDLSSIKENSQYIRNLIINSKIPYKYKKEVITAYKYLSKDAEVDEVDVAVRSSANIEDLPLASFAGQLDTYLNIKGVDPLFNAIKHCYASLYTERAILYRKEMGYENDNISMSVGIQRMVRSDLACSGVMFTIDPKSGFKKIVLISASYGLGESIVQGIVNPDEYYVFKPTLMKGYKPIIQKRIGSKDIKLIYDVQSENVLNNVYVKNVSVPEDDRNKYVLSDNEILLLSQWACLIEEHYTRRNGRYTPMDIEWAKDGLSDKLFILQARPETVHRDKSKKTIEIFQIKRQGSLLVEGKAIGEKISQGKVRVIKDLQQLDQFQPGEVLVVEKTDPDWEPILKKAAAIVTDRGGRTCHAAIVSRELGVPAVVGTETATKVLRDGMVVTVCCAEGEIGKVYEGEIPYTIEKINLVEIPSTKTKILINIGNPQEAFDFSFLPNDGVGLAREEFLLTNYVKVHPMALVNFEKLREGTEKTKIRQLTQHYPQKTDYFVEKLAEGIGMIAAAFYPKDVIVRLSDFKSNEYANLLGGVDFEPVERNPMIGFRGASRYYHPYYRQGFALECMAIKKARESFGLINIKVMIPFVRTVEEGKKVIEELAKNGLRKGENGLEIYMMCEVPSNVILAEAFCEIFDGFSIGSNDLTQFVLGVDRDSEIISSLYDERNEAVRRMIASVIQVAKEKKKKIGICGEAPSNYPDFLEFIIKEGINSISVNPNSVYTTLLKVSEIEKNIEKT